MSTRLKSWLGFRANPFVVSAAALAVAATAITTAESRSGDEPSAPVLQASSYVVFAARPPTLGDLRLPPSDLALPSPAEPEPEPEPSVSAAAVSAAPQPLAVPTTQTTYPAQLSHDELQAVLVAAGWPAELLAAATKVAWCESKWSPGALGDGGRSVGLFQLNLRTWFPYAGVDPALWNDPVVNARVALHTYNYDLARGQAAWNQWTCKPW
jgi:hypothetical protein